MIFADSIRDQTKHIMNTFSILFTSKSLLFGFLIIAFNSCEVIEPDLYPDYTGQTGQVTDIEGNVYKTIGIGSQIWMAENLKTTLFNDNSPIPIILNDSIWGHLRSPGYCWYNNDSTINKKLYGALYNFYVVETGLLCPTGWHVPDKSEWNTLESFLGGYKIAGGKLKDYYTPYWSGPNRCLVNNYCFRALPGGQRLNIEGIFLGIGEGGNWWTSTSENNYQAFSRSMSHESTELYINLSNKKRGHSVRCIKD
jgi:uncharacterized protein (TIGR02145 family)